MCFPWHVCCRHSRQWLRYRKWCHSVLYCVSPLRVSGWLFDVILIMIIVVSNLDINTSPTSWIQGCLWSLWNLLWSLMSVASVGVAMSQESQGLIVRAFGWSPLTALAKYSFGAYIYQFGPLVFSRLVLPSWSASESCKWLCLVLTWMMAAVSRSETFFGAHVRGYTEGKLKS